MSRQQLKPSVEQLQSMIVAALSYCRNPIIVVDGLDEAFEREGLCELLQSQFGLARQTAQPLYYAASYGLTETVRSLVQAGARLDDKAGRFGGTALHAACYRGHPDIARFLLEAGADYTIQYVNGATAWNLCGWMGDQEIAELFQKRDKFAMANFRFGSLTLNT
jgi:ankyrin repeat protein